jgi:hypothetical protein
MPRPQKASPEVVGNLQTVKQPDVNGCFGGLVQGRWRRSIDRFIVALSVSLFLSRFQVYGHAARELRR